MPRPSKVLTPNQLIDEFAELDRLMKLYKPQIDEHKRIKELILALGDNHQAANQVPLLSKHFQVLLSARKNKSWIQSKQDVFERVGEEKFIDLAVLTLEGVRDAGLHDLIQTDRIGNREIVSVAGLHPAE